MRKMKCYYYYSYTSQTAIYDCLKHILNEYRLTSYTDKSLAESNNMSVIINGLKPYDGDTLQEKIVSFLITDIGVTEAEIESIRSIFLEE